MVAKSSRVGGKGVIKKQRSVFKPKVPLHIVTGDLLGREYCLGGDFQREGTFDCWGMIKEYVRLRYTAKLEPDPDRYPVPAYEVLYRTNPSVAIEFFIEFLEETFVKVVPEFRRAGDIIAAKVKGSDSDKLSIGIYGGQNVFIITSPGCGCFGTNLSHYNVIGAYRWPLLSR